MWTYFVVTDETGPRSKTNYEFRHYWDSRGLVLVRVMDLQRRAKNSHRWHGKDRSLEGVEVPEHVMAEARERADKATSAIASCLKEAY